jgi:hypothetical protein
MTPRDWMLVKRGHDDQAKATKPGANAPSAATVAELVKARQAAAKTLK